MAIVGSGDFDDLAGVSATKSDQDDQDDQGGKMIILIILNVSLYVKVMIILYK